MAIDRARLGESVGYLARLDGFSVSKGTTVSLYMCSSRWFPQGFTGANGQTYDPRMSDLVIDRDLGKLGLGKSALMRETATFSVAIGGYSDADFWTVFYGGGAAGGNDTRLETARIVIWLID